MNPRLSLLFQALSFSLSLTHTATAAAAKSVQSCPTLCDPTDGSDQAPQSLGFSRQEHWSGLPFPSPVHERESEVSQSCPTLSDPMDCSLPGSSIHGIFQAKYWSGVPLPSPVTQSSIYLLFQALAGEGNGTLLQNFAWKIPWMEEPGRLKSMGLLRVGHD